MQFTIIKATSLIITTAILAEFGPETAYICITRIIFTPIYLIWNFSLFATLNVHLRKNSFRLLVSTNWHLKKILDFQPLKLYGAHYARIIIIFLFSLSKIICTLYMKTRFARINTALTWHYGRRDFTYFGHVLVQFCPRADVLYHFSKDIHEIYNSFFLQLDCYN